MKSARSRSEWRWSCRTEARDSPQQTFGYTSAAIISTETGTMRGNYEMEYLSGKKFIAPVDSFLLSIPHVTH